MNPEDGAALAALGEWYAFRGADDWAIELLEEARKANIVLELEIGVVGGEEDGVVGEINEKLYSTVEDAMATVEALGLGERGRYILAASHAVDGPRTIQGQTVAKVHHVSTLTFVNP